ncbi:MAG: endolytic transglycosylase MltG [Candidatus Cloacimonetes bacterium]|nr:endolytic transglycosylase MltG [Candidatus Cloacimonadota bacterium]
MKIFTYILLGIVALFLLLKIWLMLQPLEIRDTIIDIGPGENASTIADSLLKHSIIRSKFWFLFFIKSQDIEHELKQGKYLFTGKQSLSDVIDKIHLAKVVLKRITLPEGLTALETIELLTKKKLGKAEQFRNIIFDSPTASRLTGMEVPSLEGFLYPETYYLPHNASEIYIIETLVNQFFKVTAEILIPPDSDITFYEYLVLASIIEEEALFRFEKPLIASVYRNRIDSGWKLEADPTILYALELKGERPRRVLYRHLKIESPYNTYRNNSLPPTPICSPAISSINAAIKPASTGYYFFFATRGGKHIFSETFQQHIARQKAIKSGI